MSDCEVPFETVDDSSLRVWSARKVPRWVAEELKGALDGAEYVAHLPARLRADFPPPFAMFPPGSRIIELGDMSNLVAFAAWPMRTF